MNAVSIPVIVADAASGESSQAVPVTKLGEAAKDAASTKEPAVASVVEVVEKDKPDASSGEQGSDDVDALSDSAILALESVPAAPVAEDQASGVRAAVLEDDDAKPWRAPPPRLAPKPRSSDAALASDTGARESTAPVWMNARKGAKPQGAVVGASTIFFFVALILAIAGSSLLALVYVSPDAQSRARATAASRIEPASTMMPTASVPVVTSDGPTIPVIVTAPEDAVEAPAPPQARPASAAPAKQPAPAAAPIRPAPVKAARAAVTPSSNAKRPTPSTPTTTRARLSITTSPF